LINHQQFSLTERLLSQVLKWFLLLTACIVIYAKFIEPNWIEINSLQLPLNHLAAEFNGYRIVQISDIHRDRWMTPGRLNHIVNLVNAQNPDLVAITGDLVTRDFPQFIPSLGESLRQLHPRDQVVAVLGNHDIENDTAAIIRTLQQNGIIHIGNSVYTIKRGNAMLHIAGINDACLGKDRLDLVLQQLPNIGAAILLAHEPDFADISAAVGRFDLQLSGHSHGGQVVLPGTRPLILPFMGKKYYSGLYNIRRMFLYTNRGLGMTGLHLRFGARPEITVINLTTNLIS
jgi:predicted MPP superfamily phosphohydrolase